jgi:hypothetical protein
VPSPGHDRHLLDSLLTDQATRLLERYGDTFYILGLALDSTGTPLGISTRHWPPLSATPDEWGDSLRAAFGDYRTQMRAAAYLNDFWRQTDSTRADSTFAIFHFETPGGACYESRRHYDISQSSTPIWGPQEERLCRLEIWQSARPRGH